MARSWCLLLMLLLTHPSLATLRPPMGRSTWIETTTHTTVSQVPPATTTTVTTTRFSFHRRTTHTTGQLTILRMRDPNRDITSPLVGTTVVFGLSQQGQMTHTHLSAEHAKRLPVSLHAIGDRVMVDWNTRWELSQHRTPGSFWTTIHPMRTPQGIPMDKYTVWMVTAHSPLQIIAYHHTNAPLLVQTIQTHYPRFPHPTSFPKIAPITPEFTVSGTQQIRFDTANMLRQENSEQTFIQTQLDGHVIGSISETKRVTWRRIR